MQSVHENRIYSLHIHCGENYPDMPPVVQFISRINLPCVDPRSGKVSKKFLLCVLNSCGAQAMKVDNNRLGCLYQWKREFTMETVLIELRR